MRKLAGVLILSAAAVGKLQAQFSTHVDERHFVLEGFLLSKQGKRFFLDQLGKLRDCIRLSRMETKRAYMSASLGWRLAKRRNAQFPPVLAQRICKLGKSAQSVTG